jgi:pimeloyl-ACP methyl ester carboxylesterase
MKHFVAALLAFLSVLAAGLASQPAQAANLTCPSQTADSVTSVAQIPVVYVHGWTANGASAERDTLPALGDRLGPGYRTFAFDYVWANTTWGAEEKISGCLARFVEHLSDASLAGGGAGQVAIVAHSMGGIVSRAATGYLAKEGRSDSLAGIVTLGTPHQGTPFSGGLATNYEYVARMTPKFNGSIIPTWDKVATPPNDSPASKCLAFPHPDGCAMVPYVQPGQKIGVIAGQTKVTMTLFNLNLFNSAAVIDIGDSIVPTSSALGYPGSLVGASSPKGAFLGEKRVVCERTSSLINATALKLGIFDLGRDDAYLDEMNKGRAGIAMSSWAASLSFIGAPCNHGSLPTSEDALGYAVDFINSLAVGRFGLDKAYQNKTPDIHFQGASGRIPYTFNYRSDWNVTTSTSGYQIEVKNKQGQQLAELSFPLDWSPVAPMIGPTYKEAPAATGKVNIQPSNKNCTWCSLQLQSFIVDSREASTEPGLQGYPLQWEKPIAAVTRLATDANPPSTINMRLLPGIHEIGIPGGKTVAVQLASIRYFDTKDQAQAWLQSADHAAVSRLFMSLRFQ